MVDMYKFIFEKTSESVCIFDKNRKLLCSNKAYSNLSDDLKCIGIELSKELNNLNWIESSKKIELRTKENKIIEIDVRIFQEENLFFLFLKNNSDLKDIDKTHIEFISTVSHELRTPLTSIKGFADTLLSAGDKLDHEHQIRFIKIIKSQVDRLTRLVENLLTVSKFESRKNENIYKEINVKKLVQSTIDSLIPKYEKYSFHNDIKDYTSVWADSDKLQQVMTNLVDNAAKYSPVGSSVWIESGFNHDNQNMIDITVKDEGVGIPSEYHDKIFTRFSRIDNPLTREVQGTGLGLYITKSLVESMNGKISLKGNKNCKGTCFTVSLPCFNGEKHTKEKFYQE